MFACMYLCMQTTHVCVYVSNNYICMCDLPIMMYECVYIYVRVCM